MAAPKAETTRPSSAAASVPAAAADCVCTFVDLESQNNLAARLLGCLANETVLQKRSAEDGAQRLRLALLPDDKDRKKKGGLTLAALGERVSQAEAKASKTSLGHEGFTTKLFTSRDELQKRHEAALASLDADGFRHSKRAALASELLRAWDAAQTVHCGTCGLVPGSEAAEQHRLAKCAIEPSLSPPSSPARALTPEAPAKSSAPLTRLSCVFRPVACVHEGCLAYFSATHLASHEARCAFKLLDCPRGCGAQAQRQHLDAHLEGPCPNKPVTCPLAGLGCEAEGLTQGTLAAHVCEAAGDHAVLLAASLGAHGLTLGTCLTAQAEAQAQVEALKGRLAAEEAERRELRAQVERSA